MFQFFFQRFHRRKGYYSKIGLLGYRDFSFLPFDLGWINEKLFLAHIVEDGHSFRLDDDQFLLLIGMKATDKDMRFDPLSKFQRRQSFVVDPLVEVISPKA